MELISGNLDDRNFGWHLDNVSCENGQFF